MVTRNEFIGWNYLGIGVALLVLFAASAWGQEITAGIRGTVTDPTGAVVAGAKVEAKNTGTGYTRNEVSDSTGGYVFTLLPVGTYNLTVTMSGFKQYVRSGILLTVNQIAGVNATLALGSVAQGVEVKASPVVVNTQTSETGMIEESKQISELPLNGRNPVALVGLAPGVVYVDAPTYNGSGGVGGAGNGAEGVNGNRYFRTQYNLDGGEYDSSWTNISPWSYPNPDALQEFRFITGNYSADFGREPGGIMNVITKSGTNQIHGSLWEFNRNSAYGAIGRGNVTKPFLNQNQFGFTVGGPILKNKLFGFGTWQGLRIAQSTVSNANYPPTMAERNGDFSADCPAKTDCIIDPLTNQPFKGNQVPQNRFDPLAAKIMAFIPPPNQAGGLLYQQASTPVKNHQYLIKTDYQASTNNRLTVSLFRDLTVPINPSFGYTGFGGGFTYDNVTGNEATNNQTFVTNFAVSDTHIFKPNLLNQFRFGYLRERGLIGSPTPAHPNMNDLDPNWPKFPAALEDLTSIWITGRVFALRGFWQKTASDDYQVSDKVNYIRGRHSLKFGAEYKKATVQQSGCFYCGGIWWSGYVGTQSGNPVSDFLLGIASAYVAGPSTSGAYQNSWGGYGQDDIKVNPRLTLNLGLRYQLGPFWTPTVKYTLSDGTRVSGLTTWNAGQQSTLFPNAPKGLVYAGDPGIPLNGSFTDKTNFTPRLGFGWDIFGTGKTSLRGGFGLFDELPSGIYQNVIDVPFGANAQGYNVTSNAGQGFENFPSNYSYPPRPLDRNQSFAPYLPYSSQSFLGLHARNSMTYEYNLTLEQQLGRGVVLSAGYVGNQARRLPWAQNIDPAVYIPGTDSMGNPLSTGANEGSRRVLNMALPPGSPITYGEIAVWSDTAQSSYNSLQVQLRTSDWHGLTTQASYTWSHAIDDQTPFNVQISGNEGNQNPNCLKCDWGNSDFDHRHMLILSYTYRTPSLTRAFKVNNLVARKVFDDWGFSGITTLGTGAYFGIQSGNADGSLAGQGQDRAQQVGDWHLPSGRSDAARGAEFFNTAAFTSTSPGNYGNTGRNFIPTPGYWGTDLALLKHIPFGKEAQREVEIRVEGYNAFNHFNFAGPNVFGGGNTVGSPGFGTANQGAVGGRILQLGAKIYF